MTVPAGQRVDVDFVAGAPCRLRGELSAEENEASPRPELFEWETDLSHPPSAVVGCEGCCSGPGCEEMEMRLEVSERRALELQEELLQRDAEIQRLRSTEEELRMQEAQVRRRALEEVRAVRAEVAETWQQHLDLRLELAEAEAKRGDRKSVV